MKRPNVIFILTDDQRYGTIRALGNDEIFTPNLDRIVKRGTSFLNAHIPGGTSSAVCMPSRAMINSGRSLFHLTECGKNIPDCEITMGQCFLNAGYHSIGIGKWHNGIESYARSFDSGDNIFFGGMWDHWNVPVNNFDPEGKYSAEINFTPNFTANEVPVQVRADHIKAGCHSTELFTDSAIDFVDSYNDEKPFFMYLSYLAPHDPRTMPAEFRNMYDPEKITLPPNFAEMPTVLYGWAAKGRDENVEAYPRRPEKIKQHIADYYAMISHIDFCVGRLLDALEARSMLDDTIIVFCGDNGLAIGQHGLMGKQNIYEHSVRVPLLMCGPGIEKDKKTDAMVYLFDIFPTLCELCGLERPENAEGVDFAPVLRGESESARDCMYFAFMSRIRGVCDGRYKLIEFRTENLKLTQLFDLQNDPWERYNLFEHEGYDDITAALRQKLYELRDEWDDESVIFGEQFWQQYRRYDEAALRGMMGPKGANMSAQVASWGTEKK